MQRKPPPGIATFDSATAFLQGLARCLHGAGFPALGKTGLIATVGHLANLLPDRLRELAFEAGGPAESIGESRVGEVDAKRVAEWMASLYPQREYPAVMIGSSNGALAHACAAMGIPWLPQTFLCLARQRHGDPDDGAAAMERGVEVGQVLLERNPGISAHHMHDPNQDRRMTPWVSYFRLKYVDLPQAYRRFLAERLAPGGTVYIADCGTGWPLRRLADRHFFQFGAVGGASAEEYFKGSDRVAALFKRLGKDRRQWHPPAPDCDGPEAEWGFEPGLAAGIGELARERGLRTVRLGFGHPEDASPAVADFYRAWYSAEGIGTRRLVVPSFILHDPYWTIRTGSVPYWMVFNVEGSLPRIRRYVERAGPFDEIGMMLFPNGTEAVGQVSIADCREVLWQARQRGFFLGVDERAYPRDFAALKNYHIALKKLRPHWPVPSPARTELFEEVVRRPGSGIRVEEPVGHDHAPSTARKG